jgi:NAD(P)-dependent dehydrogenase (short-subunit alcohol dehydrogenase family)
MSGKPRLIIAGMSSFLGTRLIEEVLACAAWEIGGLFHTNAPRTEGLIARCIQAGSQPAWFAQCDFAAPATYPDLTPLLPPDDTPLTLVYMCGAWHCGPLGQHDLDTVRRVIDVGLAGPVYCCSEIARLRGNATASTRCLIVSGLGGERAGVGYLSLYGSVTGGIYNFVRAAGMECAGSPLSVVGLALGLLDKGQPYIRALCEQLVIGTPTAMDEVVHALKELALHHRAGVNGAIVEIAGGLANYERTANILSGVKQ